MKPFFTIKKLIKKAFKKNCELSFKINKKRMKK